MNEKKKALYVWNWDCGGYNQVYAHTKSEALKEAEKIWPGHKPVNVKRLGRKQTDDYWANFPLMD